MRTLITRMGVPAPRGVQGERFADVIIVVHDHHEMICRCPCGLLDRMGSVKLKVVAYEDS